MHGRVFDREKGEFIEVGNPQEAVVRDPKRFSMTAPTVEEQQPAPAHHGRRRAHKDED